MRITFIANPYAGRGRARALIEDIQARAGGLGIDATVELTQGPGDGVRLAREVRGRTDVIGIIGGDGTVHEVINGLMPEPLPIAIFPAGTGNDFASLLAGPTDLDDLTSMLQIGMGARIDLLDFDGRFCCNSAGFGFEGMVNQRSHQIKRLKGTALYLMAVFKTLASLQCPRFDIKTSDGRQVTGERLMVSIGNGVRTGGGFYLTPKAYPDDGLIDVCVIETMSRLKVLTLLPKSMNGSHVEQREVLMLRAEWIDIQTDPGFPMHIDGELVAHAPETLRVSVRTRVLPVLCKPDERNRLRHPVEQIL